MRLWIKQNNRENEWEDEYMNEIADHETEESFALKAASMRYHTNERALLMYGHISHWDTSEITDMRSLFEDCKYFNYPIGNWDVSNVLNMSRMFLQAKAFNQPLGEWNVSNVVRMTNMFSIAHSFNQPLNDWNISQVRDLKGIFYDARSFNQPLDRWLVLIDPVKVNVDNMLKKAIAFDHYPKHNNSYLFTNESLRKTVQKYIDKNLHRKSILFWFGPISDWDTSRVTDMSELFYLQRQKNSFNEDISRWDVSHVTNMARMFYEARAFNQPLTDWNVTNVTDMTEMFYEAHSFNQQLDRWKVGKGTSRSRMFYNALKFNESSFGSDWKQLHPDEMIRPVEQSDPL